MKVLFLFGGKSVEHEVSLRSAHAILENLDKSKFDPIEVGITKKGAWVIGEDANELKKGNLISPEYELIFSKNKIEGKSVLHKILKGKVVEEILFNLVFPILHGTYGEDGTLQGLLEFYEIPYVGPNLSGALLGIDKALFKKLMQREGIPVTEFNYYHKDNYGLEKVIKETSKLGYPVFVKPSNLGSSVGISKVKHEIDLQAALRKAFCYWNKVLIEKAVDNVCEIEISVLGNLDHRISVPGEIIPGDEFYTYDDKYKDDKTKFEIPAKLKNFELETIKNLAKRAYKTIDCRGMARVDFLIDGQTRDIYLNELNTIPGFTKVSMYPKLWEASSLTFRNLVTELIDLGMEEYKRRLEIIVD